MGGSPDGGVNGYPYFNGALSTGFDDPSVYSNLHDFKDQSFEFNPVNPPSPPFGVILDELSSFLDDYSSSSSGMTAGVASSPQFGASLDDFSSRPSGTSSEFLPSPVLEALLNRFGTSPLAGMSPEVPLSPPVEDLLNEFISSPSSGTSPEVHSPEDSDSDPVLKYINQMLMEENMEEKHSMFTDPLALQAAEKPFYEALVHDHPPSPNQHLFVDQFAEISHGYFSGSAPSEQLSFSRSDVVDFAAVTASGGNQVSLLQRQTKVDNLIQQSSISQPSFSWSGTSGGSNGNRSINSSLGMSIDPGFFSQRESMLLFQKGMEEASKFLPKSPNLVIDLESMNIPDEPKGAPMAVVKEEWEESPPDRSRGRRVHSREDGDLEDSRSNKQSAVSVYVDENELVEMFDKVLLWNAGSCTTNPYLPKGGISCLDEKGHSEDSRFAKGHSRKQDNHNNNNNNNNKNEVDLRTQLILCAQATASDDRRTADELLRQIRQHSSPVGNGSQRLAHYFADALEARLAGTGSQIYTALAPKRTTAAEVIKAFQVFLSSNPFKKFSYGFGINSIFKASEKAETLHIIDFGILYGFQWPTLIQRLSERPGGSPKLRITGIELPQPGFRPLEQVEATGRRLQRYCDLFGVPFEYHPIAQKWETIKIKDLNIRSGEFVAVNTLFRFKNLLDETIVVDSPRDAVLNLIRKIKPNIFVQGVVNGCFNAPFFITRFREALFHFSTLFDLLDATIRREQPERLMYEKEFFGREIMNVVACEGTERVERPETYKQWQVRNMNAGFKQLPLDPEMMKKLTWKAKTFYHKDFLIDADGCWMLQGWKGRILYASSAWVPS
ncbi:hypothetical protein Dimus_009158 [Dionaea muscipula]